MLSARVSALTGSVPRKLAEALQSVLAHLRNRTQVAQLKPLVRIHCLKKRYMTCRISPPATDFFCVQDCSARTFQVEYRGQTQYTRILERKPLIDISYHIQHRLELKYFHFAQFLLNAHRAAH